MDEIERPELIVVSDAGPLIHLDEVGSLDLLGDFDKVLVPDAVWSEVLKHRPSALTHTDVLLHRTEVESVLPERLLEIAQSFSLHTGELQALQIALSNTVDLLLTDDTAARLAGKHLGLSVHGTIGILLRSVRRGLRTPEQIAATLRSLPTESTLHLKASLLDEVIRAVESHLPGNP
jgi:predicted nucleic acid-binding protein